jgi:cyclic beta-1,2-glucan synthetase
MARQTWSFFETFVTGTHHMLPPDNFQETPHPVIANRTSPTNIGLYLLSIATAREFGWLGTIDAVQRLEATFASLDKLERFRGHFYNWYDTHDLRALDPKYISTVDSGNLAGHLLALEGACRGWMDKSSWTAVDRRGTLDTLEHMQRVVRALDDGRRNYGVSLSQLDAALEAMRLSLESAGAEGYVPALAAILEQADNIHDIAQALTDERGEGSAAPLLKWADMLRANVSSHHRDIRADAEQMANLVVRLGTIGQRSRALALAMDFAFLVEPDRQLLSIGYSAAERVLDPSCYDLLGSEARLASFVAIAKRRSAGASLVQARPVADSRRSKLSPGLMGRFHVRVPHAHSRHARARGQSARRHIAADRQASNRVRPRAESAVGSVRVRVQRA